CAQSLSGNELLAAYKMHFSGKYQELKQEIERWTGQVWNFADEKTVLELQRTTDGNARLLTEWKEYISVSEQLELDVDKVYAALRALRAAGLALLDRKAKSPLEPLEVGLGFEAALRLVGEAKKPVDAYNSTVDLVNGVVRAKKE